MNLLNNFLGKSKGVFGEKEVLLKYWGENPEINPLFSLIKAKRNKNDKIYRHFLIRWDSVIIVPIFYINWIPYTILVEEFRYAVMQNIKGFPAGMIRWENMDPEYHAKKELNEETGIELKWMKGIKNLFKNDSFSSPWIMDESYRYFLIDIEFPENINPIDHLHGKTNWIEGEGEFLKNDIVEFDEKILNISKNGHTQFAYLLVERELNYRRMKRDYYN